MYIIYKAYANVSLSLYASQLWMIEYISLSIAMHKLSNEEKTLGKVHLAFPGRKLGNKMTEFKSFFFITIKKYLYPLLLQLFSGGPSMFISAHLLMSKIA